MDFITGVYLTHLDVIAAINPTQLDILVVVNLTDLDTIRVASVTRPYLTLMNSSMSPIAGTKSGMNGLRGVSSCSTSGLYCTMYWNRSCTS